MNEAGVFGKGKDSTTGVETNIGGPVAQIGRVMLGEVVVNSFEVEVPSISTISLD